MDAPVDASYSSSLRKRRGGEGEVGGSGSNTLSSSSIRLFLLLVAVVFVACFQFYFFHTSSAASLGDRRGDDEWKLLHKKLAESKADYWRQKYQKQLKETGALRKEMEVVKAKLKDENTKVRLHRPKRQPYQHQESLNRPLEGVKSKAQDARRDEEKQKEPAKEEKLNILLLYGDDWRYDSFAAAGNKVIETPALDKLAKEGIMFTHNCVTTSICGISRATLQTGQFFSRHECNPHKRDDESLPNFLQYWNETLNGLIRNEGYHVGFVGKWQIRGNVDDKFDVFRQYFGFHDVDGGKDHITAMNERDALDFLSTRPREKPFFLTVSFFATHALDGDPRQYVAQNHSSSLYADATVPIAPSATEAAWQKLPHFFVDQNEGRSRWRQRYNGSKMYQHNMKNMYRMATEVDSSSGRIMEELERQGVLDNTLVIFTTDNGNIHAEHGLADKWYPYQESIRVPLVIKDPRMGKDKIGTTNDEFTLNIDLAPTIVSAAGVRPPKRMQGRDIADLYLVSDDNENREEWRKHFFYEHPEIDCDICIPGSEALVTKDMKYFYWPAHNLEQLFDLKADPYEENDVFEEEEYAIKLQALRELFKQLKKEAL